MDRSGFNEHNKKMKRFRSLHPTIPEDKMACINPFDTVWLLYGHSGGESNGHFNLPPDLKWIATFPLIVSRRGFMRN